jgi:hypothetical protein
MTLYGLVVQYDSCNINKFVYNVIWLVVLCKIDFWYVDVIN